MNKRVKTYLLLFVVIAIWGTIGYKIFDAVGPDEQQITTESAMVTFQPNNDFKKDTFSIQNNHYDPFLNQPYYKQQLSKEVSKKAKTQANITFPKILYRGAISKKNKANTIFILEINGIQRLCKIGKQIDSITVVKADKKAVTVLYKGVRKTITVE